jgi:hypothetical protein
MGGCEISLIIGIDFTKSNEINQLHIYDNENQNEYTKAIRAVGEVL